MLVVSHDMEFERVEYQCYTCAGFDSIIESLVCIGEAMLQFRLDISGIAREALDAESIACIASGIDEELEIPGVVMELEQKGNLDHFHDCLFCSLLQLASFLFVIRRGFEIFHKHKYA